jgi:hypothetical protein
MSFSAAAETLPLLQSRRKAGSWLPALLVAVAAFAAISLCVISGAWRGTTELEATTTEAGRVQTHLARMQELGNVRNGRLDLESNSLKFR